MWKNGYCERASGIAVPQGSFKRRDHDSTGRIAQNALQSAGLTKAL